MQVRDIFGITVKVAYLLHKVTQRRHRGPQGAYAVVTIK